MSVEDELRDEIATLKARVAELEAHDWQNRRLGPRPQTQADIDEQSRRLTKDVEKALAEIPPVDRSNVCTTSGEPVAKVRAEQTETTGQHKAYIVLCDEERAKGFVRPYRDRYQHRKCGGVTTMGRSLSETYARDPTFYGATFCCQCNGHFPVAEFTWSADGLPVGS